MNPTQVTGMQVTAKSTSKYLLLKDVASGETGDSLVARYMDSATNESKTVYPVAFVAAEAGQIIMERTIAQNHWYTATNANRGVAADSINSVVDLGTLDSFKAGENRSDFILEYKTSLTLFTDIASTSGKIKATYTSLDGDAATKVVVKVNNEWLALDAVDAVAETLADVTITSAGDPIEVLIYVYIDGNSTNVNTDYVRNSDGTLTGNTIVGSPVISFDLVTD